MKTDSIVNTPFSLPCGQVVPNRIVKAAMEENMAGPGRLPGYALLALYRYWAHGGAGMIITGNVMVDSAAMTGPGGVVLESSSPSDPFERWASVIKSGGALAIMQINHPGRQSFVKLKGKALAPSAVPLNMGRFSKQFVQPKAMSCEEIRDVCQRFVSTAKCAQNAGFDGVEVHAAHGYLLSQFLSPLTNHRQDEYGGCLENRARLLLNIVSQIRATCGKHFAILIKLNSADFQRGGFTIKDARRVIAMLERLDVDVIELSGGSYEVPAMQGQSRDHNTLAREAYFLKFAREILVDTRVPIMTTGGVKQLAVAEQVIEHGCAFVGMASAFAVTPDLPLKWQSKPDYQGVLPYCSWQNKVLVSLAKMAMVRRNLRRLGNNLSTVRDPSPLWSLVQDMWHKRRATQRYLRERARIPG
ncbi:2,4-dienoyl-CoA reductase [Alteromonas aestuariivivens]|uniref:2,4-dienoyl-CoA reductase n=1 Tax=Alteromonas aestuariivivens TaxID=1938339 RepID=A0A3D8M8G4_9ALTE|nr:NADH:flavin oxidoreductase/NADH oxidase family protein [Alteromonas aestuariivivens]RDV26185.1 2,4-dienoyl-CoA reductase [Alteromonas aestuariivivens]